jgi:signal transduction histidine kinase
VRVPPFFWETIWFWLAIGAAGVVAVALGVQTHYKRETARQIHELEQQHAVECERTRIARDIHDDVGAGLTEVALLSELAQEEAGQPAQLFERLDHIFRRSRELTQSLDEIVWAINPANDTLESFLSYIGEFAQDFLATAGLTCRLDLPRDLPALTVRANVRHHLCLAVKEALHNTVKHAGASEVHVRVDLLREELTVTIQDNGTGFVSEAAPAITGGHDGLSNLHARLREIGGHVQQQSEPGRGTRTLLSVKLPTATESSRTAQ